MALFYVRNRPGNSRSVLWLLGAGRDCLFTAVTEMEGHCATGADGAFVEQNDIQVWAENQLIDVEFGGFLALHNWGCSWGLNPPVSRSARVM